jgi:ElaB/YqjD/DUF883 family membrane-anchored ribosome-binding protein
MAQENSMADPVIDHAGAQMDSLLSEAPALQDQIERVKLRIEDLDKRARQIVRERPVIAVGAALLFGYALGRLLARR